MLKRSSTRHEPSRCIARWWPGMSEKCCTEIPWHRVSRSCLNGQPVAQSLRRLSRARTRTPSPRLHPNQGTDEPAADPDANRLTTITSGLECARQAKGEAAEALPGGAAASSREPGNSRPSTYV